MTFLDRNDFKIIFEQFQNDIYKYIYYLTGDNQAAEDILQDVFVKLWENRKSVQIERPIKSYLYTAAKNSSLNYIRHNKVIKKFEQSQKNISPKQSPPSFLSAIENEEFKINYLNAVKELPDQQRTIFMMSRHDNLSYNEISQRLNISTKTVETHIGRALKTLVKKLTPLV
jgi:RNA polymerase sigma-70 factor, ECF subfamily